MTALYRLHLGSTALLLGTLLAASGLIRPADAQDGPVHGTVQSATGQTVTIELNSGYRVQSGREGTIWATKMTLGEETTVEQGQIRVQEADGRSVTAQVTEGKGIEEGQDVRFDTVREIGTLTVRVQPEEATIYKGNEPLGEGTVERVVDAGPHKVQAVADGYNAEEQSVLVERGEEEVLSLNLSRSMGRLTVETTPSSAEVGIETSPFDYEQIGRTPVRSYEYEAGTYDLQISKDGYQTISDEVTLEAGALTEKSYTLKKKMATLIVTSEPTGARVYVDGNYRGTTRLETEVKPNNWHDLKVQHSGYQNEEERVYINSGERESLSFDMSQITTAGNGSSTDNSSSSDAEEDSGTSWLWTAALIGGIIYLTSDSSEDDGSDSSSSSSASVSSSSSANKGISIKIPF